jgi:F-actin capping protein alpha subunit
MPSSDDRSIGDILLSLPPAGSSSTAAVDALAIGKLLDPTLAVDEIEQQLAIRQCQQQQQTAIEAGSQIEHILNKTKEYQATQYKDKGNVTVRCTIAEVSNDGKEDNDDDDDAGRSSIVLRTYAELNDGHNCSAGAWRAVWKIVLVDEKTAKLSGSVQLQTHFSEQANLQFRSARDASVPKLVGTDEELVHSRVAAFERSIMSYKEQLATALIKQIALYESDYYSALVEAVSDADAMLRPLRRVLPVTKTRFKWDSAAQRNVQLLNARKTA